MSLYFSLRSSENIAHKVAKKLLFIVFHASCFTCFSEQNLHFAPFSLSILVAYSLFFKPNYSLLAPKILLFNDYFALFGHVLTVLKGFVLYNHYVLLCFLPRILHQNALHLAPKRTAFSTILHCVLHHIAVRFASNRSTFSCK